MSEVVDIKTVVVTVGVYDPETGEFGDITTGPFGCMVADKRPFFILPHNRQKWDLTHRVAVEIDHSLMVEKT